MSKNIAQATAEQKDYAASIIRSAKTIRSYLKEYQIAKLFNGLSKAEPECEIFVGTYSVGITVPTKSMKHMLEVLEFATAVTGIDFDTSTDAPASGQRTFRSNDYKTQWLAIIAQIPTVEGEEGLCRRIQTGVEVREVPVYKLQCEDALVVTIEA